jgi:5-methyltetrahydrofolate--homocysteine methyltransferase
MIDRLKELLDERPWLLADGATGSNLFDRGLVSGDAPELWNVDHPDRVADLHRNFVEAGADIILTNSFGGTRHRLKLHKAEHRVGELNERAASIARAEAARAGRVVLVAGSMGPTGEILEPLGPLSLDMARESFAEQAAALASGGADVLWIETMSSVEETESAIAGARTVGLPVVATLSFDTNGRTMMGVTPVDLAGLQRKHHLAGCGSNCGTGPSELVASIINLAAAAEPSAVLVAKANCGIPQFVDGAIRFNGTPEPRLRTSRSCVRRWRTTLEVPGPIWPSSSRGWAPSPAVQRRSSAARWTVWQGLRPGPPGAEAPAGAGRDRATVEADGAASPSH